MTTYLCDTSVWLALSIALHVHHEPVRQWLESVDDAGSILFCRSTHQSFLRLITRATIFAPYGLHPLTNRQAWEAFELFLADDRISFQEREPNDLERRWQEYASRQTASPNLWMDAYLAAFARAGGYTLVTTDAAFRQFPGLDLLLLGEGSGG